MRAVVCHCYRYGATTHIPCKNHQKAVYFPNLVPKDLTCYPGLRGTAVAPMFNKILLHAEFMHEIRHREVGWALMGQSLYDNRDPKIRLEYSDECPKGIPRLTAV